MIKYLLTILSLIFYFLPVNSQEIYSVIGQSGSECFIKQNSKWKLLKITDKVHADSQLKSNDNTTLTLHLSKRDSSEKREVTIGTKENTLKHFMEDEKTNSITHLPKKLKNNNEGRKAAVTRRGNELLTVSLAHSLHLAMDKDNISSDYLVAMSIDLSIPTEPMIIISNFSKKDLFVSVLAVEHDLITPVYGNNIISLPAESAYSIYLDEKKIVDNYCLIGCEEDFNISQVIDCYEDKNYMEKVNSPLIAVYKIRVN